MSSVRGEVHGERRATSGRAAHIYTTRVALHEAAHLMKPQTRAAFLTMCEPLLEDTRLKLHGYATAVVVHRYDDVSGAFLHAKLDHPPAVRQSLNRVPQEIHQCGDQ